MRFFYWFIVGLACFGCNQNRSKECIISSKADLEVNNDVSLMEESVDNLETDTISELEKGLIQAGLTNVKVAMPEVFIELKYSTNDNFFGKDVYGDLMNCYLQPEVVVKLKEALKKLNEQHPELTFLIYDGVRPNSVQQILWDSLDKPDSIKPLYVADPKKGSLHNYGVAVDLTLAERNTGIPLDLGTHYDYFGYPAYPDREKQMLKEGKITREHVANREILRKAMTSAGFTGIGSEWWHFNAFSLQKAKERYEIVK